MITKLIRRYKRPIRFGLVGVVGASVNSALLYTFITWPKLDPVLAGAIATELAILCNFTLNDLWTFSGRPYRKPWPVRAVRYNAIAAAGWVMSVATLAFMIHAARLQPMVANLFALVASSVVNYAANKYFTFVPLEPAVNSKEVQTPLPSISRALSATWPSASLSTESRHPE